jgi:hypothetical protein
VLKHVERYRTLYGPRNDAIRRSYEAYFQHDKLKTEGAETISTSDLRSAADMGIHLLSRHPHIDSLPKTIEDVAEQEKRDKAERFLRGLWRQVDFGRGGYLQQGRSWHQREVASWLINTGWVIQFTCLVPDGDGYPMPVADLLDVSACYPLWDGPRRELSSLAYEYVTSGARLKSMAEVGGFAIDEEVPDDASIVILDFWEARYSRFSPEQPDILNTVFYSVGEVPIGLANFNSGWRQLRDYVNLSPNSLGKANGFASLPFIVVRPDATPVPGTYAQSMAEAMGRVTGGLIGPMRTEWEAINKWFSMAMQDLKFALQEARTLLYRSPGAQDTLLPEEIGTTKAVDTDSDISAPLVRNPLIAATNVLLEMLRNRQDRMAFPQELYGVVTRAYSGVGLEQIQESGRVRVEPYKTGAEYLYAETGRLWLQEYGRRFGRSRKGKVKLEGLDNRKAGGFFEEEHTPDEMPTTRAVRSEIRLPMPQDLMTKANIIRALNPEFRASFDYLREEVVKFQDTALEAKRAAQSKLESSPFYQNIQMAGKLRELAEAAEAEGDVQSANLYALGAEMLLLSLTPQQGQGIPENVPSTQQQGGMVTGRPGLSPQNQREPLPTPAAPAGGGTMEQAMRNVT